MSLADNDYSPTSTPTDGETPTLDVVLRAFIDAALRDARVWLPVEVVAVVPGTFNRVSVQPLLLRTFSTLPAPVLMPVLQDLPVIQPRGNSYGIKLPVAVGDTGIALFCDRSLDVWKVQGGQVNPGSVRTHDLSDGVFVPGLYPLNTPPATPTTVGGPLDLVLYNGLAQLLMQPGGTFMQGNGALETYALLVESMTTLNTAFAALATEFASIASTGATPTPGSLFGAFAAPLAAATAALSVLTTSFTALMGLPGE